MLIIYPQIYDWVCEDTWLDMKKKLELHDVFSLEFLDQVLT